MPRRSTKKRAYSRRTSSKHKKRTRPKPKKNSTRSKSRTKPRKRTTQLTEGHKELAVHRNAFSTLSNIPRIPDGKVGASTGMQFSACMQVQPASVPRPGFEAHTMHILLYPGISSSAVVWNCEDNTPPIGAQSQWNRNYQVLGYETHTPLSFWAPLGEMGLKEWPPNTTNINSYIDTDGEISKWRLVSQACHMMLTNNDQNNDGWFETVSLNETNENANYGITTMNNLNDFTKSVVMPDQDYIDKLVNNPNLCDERTYQRGLLKDIHKYQFSNSPVTNDFDFHDVFAHKKFDHGPQRDISTPGSAGNGSKYANFERGAMKSENAINSYIDRNWDYVYIRVHGSTTNLSNIILRTISNYEMLYDTTSKFSRLHKPTNTTKKSKVSVGGLNPIQKKMKIEKGEDDWTH